LARFHLDGDELLTGIEDDFDFPAASILPEIEIRCFAKVVPALQELRDGPRFEQSAPHRMRVERGGALNAEQPRRQALAAYRR